MNDACNRRDFLKVGGTALAAAALPAAGPAAEEAKQRPIKKAIMYATIGYKGSVLDKFRAVKAATISRATSSWTAKMSLRCRS